MNEYVGLWRYAADPKGRVALDPLFGDSTLALTADGGVTTSMDGGGYVLEGRATTTSFTPDRAVLEVAYPGGRNNRLTLVPDRGPKGEVLGFLVLESEAELATSYYVR
jgi:hypothetical protein